VGQLPVVDACLVRIRNLPHPAVVLDGVLAPRLQDDLDLLLEDLAVRFVV
jgi:hypothetical protein